MQRFHPSAVLSDPLASPASSECSPVIFADLAMFIMCVGRLQTSMPCTIRQVAAITDVSIFKRSDFAYLTIEMIPAPEMRMAVPPLSSHHSQPPLPQPAMSYTGYRVPHRGHEQRHSSSCCGPYSCEHCCDQCCDNHCDAFCYRYCW